MAKSKITKEKDKKEETQFKKALGYTPIEDIIAENEQKTLISNIKNAEKERKSDEPGIVRNILGGLFSGLATTPLGVAGMVEAIPAASYNLTKAALDKDYDVSDAMIETLGSNKSFQAASYVDDKIRDLMGLKKFEDLSGKEQLANIGGELIPIVATGGASGVIKLGNKAAQKAAVKLAKKEAVKSGKALSSQAIQKAKSSADNAINMLLPGVQVTKGASLGHKAAEIGVQAGLPLATNEAFRYGASQEGIFGDYTPIENQQISLINDKRRIRGKDFVEDLAPDVVSTYNLDNIAAEERAKSEKLKNVALTGGAILGTIAAGRKLHKLFGKEITKSLGAPKISDDFIDNLDLKTKFDMTTADRFAFKTKAVDEGLLSEETANALAQDMHSKINNAFMTGNLGDGIELSFSPQITYDKLKTLKLTDLKAYNKLEQFIELNSMLQDETNRYNKYLQKGSTDLSPDEYLNKKVAGEIPSIDTLNYTNAKKLSHQANIRKNLLTIIQENPTTKQLLDEISQIGDALLKKMEASNMFSAKELESLRKNRTVDNLFLYKPRVLDTKPTIRERLSKFLLEKTPFNKNQLPDEAVRGEQHLRNVKNYLDVFENNFKQTLLDIHDNTIIRNSMKEMAEGSFAKINKALDDFDNELVEKTEELLNHGVKFSVYDMVNFYNKQIQDFFFARPIGSININSANNMHNPPKSIFTLLNRPKNSENALHNIIENSLSQKDAKIMEAIRNRKSANNIISYKENGVEHFYEVDPYIKAAFELNSELPSMFAKVMKDMKNVVQTTITGKLNPAFSVPSSLMATHEGLTLLPTLAQKLKLAPDAISRRAYLKEFATSYKDLLVNDVLTNTMRKYNKILVKTKGAPEGKLSKFLQKVNIDEIQAKLKSSLLTQIKESGGASAKPFNTNQGIFYTLNNNTKISENIEKFLLNHDGIDGAVQKIKMLDYLQQSLRETPSLALTRYLGKATGAIKDNKVVDPKKLAEVINVIGTNTANVGRSGAGYGFAGGLAKFVENYIPYGNVMIKSLAPKVRASGIATGAENAAQIIADVFDPKVRYLDILKRLQQNGSELAKNKFVEGLLVTSLMPSTIQYVWNHGSQENIEDFYSLSDYEKASKFILVNFFGKGRHLSLAKDQEVALADSLFTTMLDGVVGMSRYNPQDPAFENSRLITQSLARSIGLDSIPALDILANVSGKDINLNLFSDEPFITDLSRNKINADMSETAYQNGLLNQETSALLRSLFGVVGSTMLGAAEEANVGSQNDTGITDAVQSVTDNLTKSARILTTTKNISSFNQTSKTVYNKQNLLNKIASVSDKNDKQQQIYETVKVYNRNRIKPLHEAITSLRKEINSVKSTGRMADGTVLDYDGRKAEANEMNKKLQKLFAREYKEFENLDKLLEQIYGKGINLNNFMEKTYE